MTSNFIRFKSKNDSASSPSVPHSVQNEQANTIIVSVDLFCKYTCPLLKN